MGGPNLRPVEDVVIAVTLCLQLERGKVRTRTGLGKALAPVMLAREDPGQEIGLLLVRAVMHQHRGNHLQTLRQQVRRTGTGAFGGEDVFLHRRPASAAIFHRPVHRAPALGSHDHLPRDRMIRVREHAGRAASGVGQFGRQIITQKFADFGAEGGKIVWFSHAGRLPQLSHFANLSIVTSANILPKPGPCSG